MQEGFAFGADAEDRVAFRVAWGGEDGDRAVEDLVAVFVDDEVGLEGIEGVADIIDHRGDVVRTVGFGEVGFLGAPKVEFRAKHVDGGIGKKDFSAAREAADVINVRVAEHGVGDIGEGDPDGIHCVGKPAPSSFLMGTKTGVDEDNFPVLPQE